jgi:DNA anti-recombination protein RmuC
MELLNHPLFLSSLIGLLSIGLGWLGYKRAKRADEIAEKRGEVGEIYSGFSIILTNLQEDNKVLRDSMTQIRELLTAAELRIAGAAKRITQLEFALRQHDIPIPKGNG